MDDNNEPNIQTKQVALIVRTVYSAEREVLADVLSGGDAVLMTGKDELVCGVHRTVVAVEDV